MNVLDRIWHGILDAADLAGPAGLVLVGVVIGVTVAQSPVLVGALSALVP